MKIQEFDFSVDLLEALLWHYNDATRLQGILIQKKEWYEINHALFWVRWYIDIFDLTTANEFGLAVWSIILNLPLFIGPTPDPPDKPIWGFGPYKKNFNNGNFTTLGSSSIILTVEEKRLILRLRYWQLVSRAAVPQDNAFLNYLFYEDYGPVYILDGLDMTIVNVFDFEIPWRLQYILKKYDLIPRGSGVKLRRRFNPARAFGFGPYKKNFNNGTFFSEDND